MCIDLHTYILSSLSSGPSSNIPSHEALTTVAVNETARNEAEKTNSTFDESVPFPAVTGTDPPTPLITCKYQLTILLPGANYLPQVTTLQSLLFIFHFQTTGKFKLKYILGPRITNYWESTIHLRCLTTPMIPSPLMLHTIHLPQLRTLNLLMWSFKRTVTPGSPGGGQGPLGPADIRPAARLPPQSPGPPGIPQSVMGVV